MRRNVILGVILAVLPLLPPTTAAREIETDPAGRGLKPGFAYLGEISTNAAGGLRRRSACLGNLSLTLSLDLDKLFGWRGATIFLYGMSIQGQNPDRNVGDLQGVSNIAAHDTARLYEAWLRQDLFSGRLSFLAGLYDLNSEFDVIEPASLFLNASQGIDPTFAFSGLNGPSVFPYTTLAFRAKLEPGGGFYAQAAVLNGVAGNPDDPNGTRVIFPKGGGALLAAEAGWRTTAPGREVRKQAARESVRRYVKPVYSQKIALGLWTYTARFRPILPRPDEPARVRGDAGLYVLLSREAWQAAGDPERNLVAFARLGLANPRLNRLGFFAGGGLVFAGPFPGRGQDAVGLAFAAAFNGDDFRRAALLSGEPVRRAEWDFELTYRAVLSRWLSLRPDVQVVLHPGMDPALKTAVVMGLRAEVAL
jgi:porin